jgi:hypothetical protein
VESFQSYLLLYQWYLFAHLIAICGLTFFLDQHQVISAYAYDIPSPTTFSEVIVSNSRPSSPDSSLQADSDLTSPTSPLLHQPVKPKTLIVAIAVAKTDPETKQRTFQLKIFGAFSSGSTFERKLQNLSGICFLSS